MKNIVLIVLIIIPLFFSYKIEENLAQIESLKRELAHSEQFAGKL